MHSVQPRILLRLNRWMHAWCMLCPMLACLTLYFVGAVFRRANLPELQTLKRRSDDARVLLLNSSLATASDNVTFGRNTSSPNWSMNGKKQHSGTKRSYVPVNAESMVSYNGQYYAALDGWIPTDYYTQGCQWSPLSLPSGWSIAINNADSIAVIASYPWGTDLMVLADGSQFYTQNDRYSGMAGKPRQWYCCSDGLTPLGESIDAYGNPQYEVTSCARRILITNSELFAQGTLPAYSCIAVEIDLTVLSCQPCWNRCRFMCRMPTGDLLEHNRCDCMSVDHDLADLVSECCRARTERGTVSCTLIDGWTLEMQYGWHFRICHPIRVGSSPPKS